jgi:hypothetical protein
MKPLNLFRYAWHGTTVAHDRNRFRNNYVLVKKQIPLKKGKERITRSIKIYRYTWLGTTLVHDRNG